MTDRVVLAYSGGLDTSVGIGWIGEETGAEVIAVAVDVGQGGEDLEQIRKRALACGAVEAVVADARDEFAEQYCLPALQAQALYMNRYPLVSALSRPLIVEHLVAAGEEPVQVTRLRGAAARRDTRAEWVAVDDHHLGEVVGVEAAHRRRRPRRTCLRRTGRVGRRPSAARARRAPRRWRLGGASLHASVRAR